MIEKRPPVVVVLGSVDHGKTTLLDYIRKSNIAAKEAGGITQSIGAYEIVHKDNFGTNRKITFIDTPGHEAFSKLRSRGAKIADIAILVIAADDSVKPQTKEAIQIIQEAKIPYVVAINKIDKQPDVTKVKNDLTQAGVLLEGYGGNVSYQLISAKTGQGIDELLDLILLTADVEDLKYDPDQKAEGFILEAKLDSRRGVVVTAIIKNGTIKIGDEITTSVATGKVKGLENFLGQKIRLATASAPIRILGFNALPKVGDEFKVGQLLMKAVGATPVIKTAQIIEPEDQKTIKLILKGDVTGSVEALTEMVKTLPAKDKKLKVVDEGVGDISDGDVKLAISIGAVIVGFRVKITKPAENLARAHNIEIIQSDIIYELLRALEERLLSERKKIGGQLQILAIFSRKNKKQLIGGKVLGGEIKINSILQIERNHELLGKGRVVSLQHNKKDVIKVESGKECGLIFESDIDVQVGDLLIYKLD